MTAAGWFLSAISAGGNENPPTRIFCFPHGGGNPRVFLDWQPLLGTDAEILAVCLPGRGHRGDERPASGIADLADRAAEAIAEHAGGPMCLFGHSLGALVAFEVARRLDGSPLLRQLVASGCVAPSLLPTPYLRWAAGLPGREFAEAAGRYEGLHPAIVADEDLQELLLPDLRADLRLVADYEYRPSTPLAAGISLVNGRDDWHIDESTLEPWWRESTVEPDYHWAAGGHFYFADRPSAVVDVLRSAVRDEHVEVI